MENKNIENVGLPEIYLSPSKNGHKSHSRHKGNVWKDSQVDDSPSIAGTEESVKSKYNLNSKPVLTKNKKYLSSNGMRGETPGSDSPANVNFPPANIGNQNATSTRSPESNLSDSESDSFIWASNSAIGAGNYHPPFQRRAVEGADSNGEIPLSQQLNISVMKRNSPAGLSTPETLLNTTTTDVEGATAITDHVSKLVRPPALGQSEEIVQIFSRKDLGSTDGEDSSNESVKRKGAPKSFVENCSIGSQSENTDSTSTVLDMKRGPIQGCEGKKLLNKLNTNLSKPNFIVGGAISPRMVSDQKGSLINFKRPLTSQMVKDQCKSISHQQSTPELDDSLTSIISASSHHPESSECITSPSVISVSSVASSKKLEWDSGADVGYAGEEHKQELLTSSLCTLERIAIGSYASVLRTEPEGKGTNQIKARGSKRYPSNHKETKTTKFTKQKVNLADRKSSNKAYYSNSVEKGNAVDTVTMSSEEEIVNKSTNNSPRKRMKRLPSSHVKKSGIEMPHSKVDGKTHYGNMASSKENNCSLSDSVCSMKRNSVAKSQNKVQINLRKSNNSSISTNTSTLINSATSLPFYSTSSLGKESSLPKKNMQQSQSLEFRNFESISDKLKTIVLNELYDKNKNSLIKSCSDIPKISLEGNLTKHYVSEEDEKITNKETNSDTDKTSSSLSMNSVNNILSSLSHKLKTYIDNLMESGTVEQSEDYNKLQDYIEFIGMPSDNDDEIKLKESVADIIMRMFGDINSQSLESSSSYLTTEEMISQLSLSHSSISSSKLESKDINKEQEIETSGENGPCFVFNKDSCSLSEGNFIYVPYRPSSATRTYYMASTDKEEVEARDEPYSQGRAYDSNEEGSSSQEFSYQADRESSSVELHSFGNERVEDDQNINSESSEKCFEGTPRSVVSTSKGLYQDWHGTYHVAHQPPGYTSCVDSHQSESTSDNEQSKSGAYHNQQQNRNPSPPAGGANVPPVWTSTGSESAYETIRERHRDLGEALASSFEFYSTSPRDARLLGYVSNDSERTQANDPPQLNEGDTGERSEPSLCHQISHLADQGTASGMSSERDQMSSSSGPPKLCTPRKKREKALRKTRSRRSQQDTSNVTLAESEGATSGVSVIQVRKQKYVNRITKYINTLEKLEKALMPSGESLLSLDNDGLRGSDGKTRRGKKEGHRGFDAPSRHSGPSMNQFLSSENERKSSSKSSIDFGGESFIIHGTASIQKKSEMRGRGRVTHSTPSSTNESPRRTSTLRKERKKGEEDVKERESGRKEVEGLEGLGNVSDFRKLMASRNVGGETRPYRFLVKKKKERVEPSSESEKRCRDSGAAVEPCVNDSDGNLKSDSLQLEIESIRRRLREDAKRGSQSEVELSEGFESDILDSQSNSQSNSERKESESSYEKYRKYSSEAVVHEPAKTITICDGRIPSNQSSERGKKVKNFGQMFPSDSYIDPNAKQRHSVALQTTQSLLQRDEESTPTEIGLLNATQHHSVPLQTTRSLLPREEESHPSEIDLNAKRHHSVPLQREVEFPPSVISPKENDIPEAKSATSSIYNPSSTLGEMEARIKSNAEKINLALAAYNKKFSPSNSKLDLLPPSFQEPHIKITKPDEQYHINSETDNHSSQIDSDYHNIQSDTDNYNSELEKVDYSIPSDTDSHKSLSEKKCPKPSLKIDPIVFPDNSTNQLHSPLHNSPPSFLSPTPESNKSKTPSVNIEKRRREEVDSKKNDGIVVSGNKKSLKFIVPISLNKRKTAKNSLVQELLEMNRKNEIMTLQEALSLARPSYVKEAERRRTKICTKQETRQKLQSHNKEVLASLPDNLKTPTVLKKFLFKSEDSPLFSYKSIREQNQRLYQNLPEAKRPVLAKRKVGMSRTNRVMAKFYSQKLQGKTLKGKTSHNHREVVTPVR